MYLYKQIRKQLTLSKVLHRLEQEATNKNTTNTDMKNKTYSSEVEPDNTCAWAEVKTQPCQEDSNSSENAQWINKNSHK